MKKILLASCVAAISAGVNAELTPLSEYELHSVTGQAGVDIELDVGVSIGEIRYTDTAENNDGDGGSLVIEDVFIGGGEGRNLLYGFSNPGNTSRLDNLKFVIDVSADGDLNIKGQPITGGTGVGVVDFLLTTGNIATEGVDPLDRHVLVDSLSIYGGASNLQMVVDGATNDITFIASVGIEDFDIDMSSSFSVKIDNMVIANSAYSDFFYSVLDPDLNARTANFYVVMDSDSVDDGVMFDFRTPLSGYNVVDVFAETVAVGGDVMGSFYIDDLSFRGVSMVVSGH
jgi:hypothetical protein